jgi:hypothetical protein
MAMLTHRSQRIKPYSLWKNRMHLDFIYEIVKYDAVSGIVDYKATDSKVIQHCDSDFWLKHYEEIDIADFNIF